MFRETEARSLMEWAARQFRFYQDQYRNKAQDPERTIYYRAQAAHKARENTACAETLEIVLRHKSYSELAMRTAAGPEVLHFPDDEDARGVATAELLYGLLNFCEAAHELDRFKSRLFYNKDKAVFDRGGFIARLRERMGLTDGGLEINIDINAVGNPQTIHAILGLATESAELVEDLIVLMAETTVENRDAVLLNVARETGDIDWFQELLAHAIGVPVESSRADNIARLQARFPNKFSEAAAIARADENGDVEAKIPPDQTPHHRV